jgi:hypothetical protein
MQFSKTAYFQLSKKQLKLKEYSEFINATDLLDDSIKCNTYFKALFFYSFLRFQNSK